MAEKVERIVTTFEIPEDLLEEIKVDFPAFSIKSIGMVELTANEEMSAAKRSRSDPLRLSIELTKQALVEVNDEKVSIANQSVDRKWEEFPAKVRNLAIGAYNELHNPDEEQQKAFLKSRRTKSRK